VNKTVIPVTFPLLNPNEPEAVLVEIHVTEGKRVALGEPLCTIETTKSTSIVTADSEGYIAGLRWEEGQSVNAGDVFCFLAASAEWQPEPGDHKNLTPELRTSSMVQESDQLPEGLRITRPALNLAQEHNLDYKMLPKDQLITEQIIRSYLEKPVVSPEPDNLLAIDFSSPTEARTANMNTIIIYGGGGHGKALIELIHSLAAYQISGIIDDGISTGELIMGVPVLGGADKLPELFDGGIRYVLNAVGGISSLKTRIDIFQKLITAGFECPTVIHPRGYCEPSAQLSAGVQVFSNAYVGTTVKVGFGTIINTGSVVSHDCTIGGYTHISPGAILAGSVIVGEKSLVGMGATLNLGIKIGAGSRIGNGATVKADVPTGSIVRAGAIWPE